ncbi:MAG: Stp1/IreP family PP2C-type Ser/Thr phosphatase [bacterium]
MASEYIVVGRTDRGLVRPGNEDYLHLDDKNAVYAVCDGMGGHQAGEVASMTASETIRVLFDQFHNDLLRDDRLSPGRALPPNGDILLRSIRLANRQIFNRAAADSSLSGMGTTVVAVALQNDLMSVAHVGDSRAYRLDERQLQPLTRDHSWVSEMQANHNLSEKDATSFVGRNVITRALGVRETVEVDYRLVKVKPGEVYILCSDGLCGFADDDEIFAVADRARSDISRIVDNLVQLANDRGGSDNVTIIVIEIKQVGVSDIPEVEVFTLPEESVEELQAEDEWLARMAAFKTEQAQTQPPSRKPPGRFLLTLIFAAFILLACVFVYFQTIK